jgi:hypothetical protein
MISYCVVTWICIDSYVFSVCQLPNLLELCFFFFFFFFLFFFINLSVFF